MRTVAFSWLQTSQYSGSMPELVFPHSTVPSKPFLLLCYPQHLIALPRILAKEKRRKRSAKPVLPLDSMILEQQKSSRYATQCGTGTPFLLWSPALVTDNRHLATSVRSKSVAPQHHRNMTSPFDFGHSRMDRRSVIGYVFLIPSTLLFE